MARDRRSRKASISNDLARWFAFGVLLGLLPLVFRFLYSLTQVPHARGISSSLKFILGNGDLFLITCCIGGAALGERVGRTAARPRIEIFLALACQIAILASVFFYTVMLTSTATGDVATASCVLFIFTVFTSGDLMILTLQGRRNR